MRKLFILSSLLVFISCVEKNENTGLVNSEKYFDTSLYRVLLNYQKLYPIPTNTKNEPEIYVYIASFYKVKDDTTMNIIRSSQGYRSLEDTQAYGPYEDHSLAPTIINDSKYFYSKNFIKKVIIDTQSLKRFRPIRGVDYSETFPPVFEYKVSNRKLLLNRIDTGWKRWQ